MGWHADKADEISWKNSRKPFPPDFGWEVCLCARKCMCVGGGDGFTVRECVKKTVDGVCISVQWVYLNIPFFSLVFSPFSSPVFFLLSLLSFTVRKGHVWRASSVQPGTNTDGRQHQLQLWVNLQLGSLWSGTGLCACRSCKNSAEGFQNRERVGLLALAPFGWSNTQVSDVLLKSIRYMSILLKDIRILICEGQCQGIFPAE